MAKRRIIAAAIQGIGIVCTAGGVELVSRWGGIVALGIGAIVFGVGFERSETDKS